MFFLKKYIYKVLNIIFLFVFALLVTESALAGVYTVGANGDYATIQLAIDDAIDAAIASPGSNEVRVEAGTTYYESILIESLSADIGTLNITGGWDSAFSTRDLDYTLTTISGSDFYRVFHIKVEIAGSLNLTLDGFTLRDGKHSSYGSGIIIDVQGATQITINNNRILSNVVFGPNSSQGGGIYAYINSSGVAGLDITNNLIKENSITSTGSNCDGAGISLQLHEGAVFNITGNVIEDNTLTTNSYAEGTGMQIHKSGSGTCDISNNIVRNNTAYGTGVRSGIGGRLCITDSSTITLGRNQWLNNVNYDNAGNACGDLFIDARDTSTVNIKDSLIAGAVNHGLDYDGQTNSVISMTNLTITDNNGFGLTGSSAGTVSLYNTIIYGNGDSYSISLPGDTGNNLIGSDPGFVDQAGQDYRLSPGSAAINAGYNSPTGGLGALDLDGNIRISQSTVDIGAYEFMPTCNPGVMLLLLN
ncbi:MAG: right-handed parallel beta-helix repeat-containing protein [Desulfobacteraceae bacterium]|nr:right-handed parallel beta-helix repeat-containing protein [Desulfobacteraceae bacterium]